MLAVKELQKKKRFAGKHDDVFGQAARIAQGK
jgi:hypothetical protein